LPKNYPKFAVCVIAISTKFILFLKDPSNSIPFPSLKLIFIKILKPSLVVSKLFKNSYFKFIKISSFFEK
jgi:hypothetical protein